MAIVKKSISLPPKVLTWAEENMDRRGYDNFSAYMAELIRRDHEPPSQHAQELEVVSRAIQQAESLRKAVSSDGGMPVQYSIPKSP